MTAYTSPIEQLIHSTVRIECQTANGISYGSGYFFGFLPKGDENILCIVTNKHVISGANKGRFCLTLKDSENKPQLGQSFGFDFDNFENMWIKHPNPDVDLAVFPIAPILHRARQQGQECYFISLNNNFLPDSNFLNSLSSMEDIVMIGYPIGLWDQKHNLPIIRKGITATHPRLDWNNRPEFLIDAACFPGSSGSPVFLANIGSFVDATGALCSGTRIALLGTLYAGPQYTATGEIQVVQVPITTRALALSNIPTNLGFVISSSILLDFEPILSKMVNT